MCALVATTDDDPPLGAVGPKDANVLACPFLNLLAKRHRDQSSDLSLNAACATSAPASDCLTAWGSWPSVAHREVQIRGLQVALEIA